MWLLDVGSVTPVPAGGVLQSPARARLDQHRADSGAKPIMSGPGREPGVSAQRLFETTSHPAARRTFSHKPDTTDRPADATQSNQRPRNRAFHHGPRCYVS